MGMEQEAITFTANHGTVTDVACTTPAVSESRKRHLDASAKLVVSSVRVRGLSFSLYELPLMMEFAVGSCSLLTEQLKPIMEDNKEITEGENFSLAAQISSYSLNQSQLGLDHLCIVIPIAPAAAAARIKDNPVGGVSNGAFGTLGGGSIVTDQGGVRVGLRTANSGAFLGSALCFSSGDWFPINPCGGEVLLMFKLFVQGEGEAAGVSFSTQASLNNTSASLSKNDCITCCTSVPHGDFAARKIHSANVCLRDHSLCAAKHNVPKCALDDRGDTEKQHRSTDLMFLTSSASSLAVVNSGQNLKLRRVFSGNNNLVATFNSEKSANDLRGLVCQPRSLVFYDISVKGFLPLSSSGGWGLEFFWPQHQVSFTKHVLVNIPKNVDKNGAAAIKGTFSVELPLFLRGEVQTHMHAVWFNDNNMYSDSDVENKTHKRVKVVFDPIIALVMDSDMRWEGLCRQASAPADCGVPPSGLALSVELSVKLEFYEPQRDGRNGRPTSAFPHHHHHFKGAGKKSNADVDEDVESETSDVFLSSPKPLMSLLLQKPGRKDDGGDGVASVSNDPLTAQRHPASAGPCLRTDDGVSHGCSRPEHPENEEERHKEEREEEEEEKKGRERGQRCAMRPVNLRRPVTAPQLYPSVEHMVPCYSEHQRRAVFHAYDTSGCGSMTRDQLLHFCRAHVALFDGEESDASILRGLQPYVRGCGGHASTMSSATEQHTLRRSEKWGYSTRPRTRAGDNCAGSSSLQSPPPRSEGLQGQSSPTAPTGLSVDEPEDITYNVFEVIALRLASM